MELLIIGAVVLFVLFSIMGSGGEKQQAKEEAEKRQKAAEDYILNSGDEEAIKQLMLMRANPSNYAGQFQKGAADNTVMRTALGVFTGFIAADLVTSAIHQHQLEEALASFETELQNLGGIDGFDLASTDGMEDFSLGEAGDLASSEGMMDDGDGGDDFWDLFS